MKAIGLVRDLFFRSKIDAVGRAIGTYVAYASTLDAAAARCAPERPAIVFGDLSDASFPAAETESRLRAVAPA